MPSGSDVETNHQNGTILLYMKIALFNCHARSIPPKKSGGIEKIMDYLIQGFIKQGGVDVTLFSTGDSFKRDGLNLISLYPNELEAMNIDDAEKEKLNAKWTGELAEKLASCQNEFDIINNHCCGCGLLNLAGRIKTLMVSTLHESLTFEAIDRLFPYKNFNFISSSYSQRKPFPELNFVENIYDAIDVDLSPKPKNPEDFLVFVGRISQQKSPHLAIAVAKRLQKKLYILGKYKDKHIEVDYYNNYFLPALKENSHLVEWIDEVDEKTVLSFFSRAYASLHPVNFREPFGLTLIEAMSCGCPVIAFNRGSIPEVIEDYKTGFVVEDVEEMAAKVKIIDKLDRNYCREYVKKKFDKDILVENYLQAYKKLLENQ